MKFEIKNRWTGALIFECEADSIRLAVEAAVEQKVSLRDANLGGADLGGADLGGADLRDANLGGANLRGADLRGANLRGADLGGADLGGANLLDANLRDANLGGADLRDADLGGADLGGADLGGANLRGADLTPIRDDLWAVLSAAPAEAQAVRDALVAGKVNGSCYEGECCCLVGTIANARHCQYTKLDGLEPNSSRPAETFFLCIKEGDTPENSQHAKLAVEWIDQWLSNMRAAASVGTFAVEGGR